MKCFDLFFFFPFQGSRSAELTHSSEPFGVVKSEFSFIFFFAKKTLLLGSNQPERQVPSRRGDVLCPWWELPGIFGGTLHVCLCVLGLDVHPCGAESSDGATLESRARPPVLPMGHKGPRDGAVRGTSWHCHPGRGTSQVRATTPGPLGSGR